MLTNCLFSIISSNTLMIRLYYLVYITEKILNLYTCIRYMYSVHCTPYMMYIAKVIYNILYIIYNI